MAQGSTQDQASYIATTELADRLGKLQRFSDVEAVFLEQPPTLTDVLSRQSGPVVVVGLFVGDGLHGGEDVARLIAALQRSDIVFAGNVGTWPEIADIVAAAVASAIG
jgi:sirohydrochlorin ferrochelatase